MCAVIAKKELAPKNMSRSVKGTVQTPGRRVRQKGGLDREILSAAFGMAHQMLSYKAVQAGTRWHLANTPQLKVCDPRNPRYNNARCLAVGEFINTSH
jgi:putative transposase